MTSQAGVDIPPADQEEVAGVQAKQAVEGQDPHEIAPINECQEKAR